MTSRCSPASSGYPHHDEVLCPPNIDDFTIALLNGLNVVHTWRDPDQVSVVHEKIDRKRLVTSTC